MDDVERQVRSIRSSKDKQVCFEKKPHLQKKHNKKIRNLIMFKHRDNKQKMRDFREEIYVNDDMNKIEPNSHDIDEWVILNDTTPVYWYQRIFRALFSFR